jgi:hypothetical protein
MQTAKVEQLKKGETTHSWSEEVPFSFYLPISLVDDRLTG